MISCVRGAHKRDFEPGLRVAGQASWKKWCLRHGGPCGCLLNVHCPILGDYPDVVAEVGEGGHPNLLHEAHVFWGDIILTPQLKSKLTSTIPSTPSYTLSHSYWLRDEQYWFRGEQDVEKKEDQ